MLRSAGMDAGILAAGVVVVPASLVAAGRLGVPGYGLPLGLVGACALAMAIRRLFEGNGPALRAMVFFAVCGLALTFRVREAGAIGLDAQNGLKFATWILMAALGWRFHAAVWALRRDASVRFLAGYFAFCLLSAAWSPVPAYTFANGFANLAWAGFAVVCATRLDDGAFLRSVLVALACECLVGVLAVPFLPDMTWLREDASASIRFAGLAGHPNVMAQHAAMLVIVWSGVKGALPGGRWMSYAILALALACLALTGSRTSMIGLAFAFAVPPLLARPRLLGRVAVLCSCLAALALASSALGVSLDTDGLFAALSRSGDASEITSATNRADLWAIAWRHVLERPVLGCGFNGAEQLMMNSVGKNFAGNAINAHNLVLHGMMTLGLVGFCLVVCAYSGLVGRMITRPDTLRDRYVVYLLCLGTAEAELLTVPVALTFLTFWLVFRDARDAQRRAAGRVVAPLAARA